MPRHWLRNTRSIEDWTNLVNTTSRFQLSGASVQELRAGSHGDVISTGLQLWPWSVPNAAFNILDQICFSIHLYFEPAWDYTGKKYSIFIRKEGGKYLSFWESSTLWSYRKNNICVHNWCCHDSELFHLSWSLERKIKDLRNTSTELKFMMRERIKIRNKTNWECVCTS